MEVPFLGIRWEYCTNSAVKKAVALKLNSSIISGTSIRDDLGNLSKKNTDFGESVSLDVQSLVKNLNTANVALATAERQVSSLYPAQKFPVVLLLSDFPSLEKVSQTV